MPDGAHEAGAAGRLTPAGSGNGPSGSKACATGNGTAPSAAAASRFAACLADVGEDAGADVDVDMDAGAGAVAGALRGVPIASAMRDGKSRTATVGVCRGGVAAAAAALSAPGTPVSVSYTHLTLPTILLV